MSCPKCGESRYWSPQSGCIVCKREEAKERFVVTLSDDQFEILADRDRHLTETLVCRHGDIELIIQRQGD